MSPFPIQEMTLPVALSGSDVIGQAKTGTGKTLGFGLPLLERVTVPADVEAGRAAPEKLTEAPQALVVVPTRELCQQVTNDLLTAGKVRNVRVLAIYGGRAYEPQVEALKKGVDIVVGTPGRLLDLAGQKKLDLSHVRSLVLDEADEMLDLGFLPDVEKIMKMLPPKRQTMLFSATMPGAVIGLARKYMSQPTHISATSPDDEGATVANITQHVFRAHNMDKPELVSRILQADGRGLAMIFCRTKRTAADIAEQLEKRGFASGAVHGDLGQGAREQALRAFRNGKVDVLVCTDVAARGIDVEGVTHVINYQSPEDEKTYLHRVGRTGRAGAKGIAVTLVDWDDIPRWKLINKALDLPFDEPEETYSTSAHLYEILSIPAGTKGILPRADRTRAGLRAEQVEDLGETGGRGRKSAPAAAAAPAIAEERAPRTPRQRRRTRNGAPVSADEATAVSQAPAAAEATEAPAEPRTPRRRRRTRAAEAVVETVEAPVPAPAAEPEAPKAPRRRTRAAAAVDTVDTVETAEGQVPAPAAESEAPKAPRRRSRAAAAVDTAESQVPAPAAEPEAPKAPRRRTRATKPAEAATEAPAPTEAEAVTEAPAKAPRRRTRAAAVDTAEGQVPAPAAEAEAPKAPRRRTRATKPAEAATEAEAAPAKAPRRRTRAAAAVDTAEGQVPAPTAEAEAPKAPRRRTRTTKPAEAATEAPAPTEAEAAPAKAPRRRTRAAAAVQPES
ncbi:DEAD/DEAH box helicase [Streptomyces flavidovirens]|uniref:DEAD/DEAH box helicase n=1 Tax=Streptomyces flavidovirens TaxID=67298 RepID=UPI0003F62974